MKRERRFYPGVALRAEASPKGTTISGYAAVFDSPTKVGYFQEVIKPGCFSRALKEQQDVRCLQNHDANLILARTKNGTLELAEDSRGLRFRALLADTSVARDLAALIERGDLDQCSFQFTSVKENWINEADADGEMQTVRELHDVDLYDVAPCTFPAYDSTSVGLATRTMFPDGVPDQVRAHQMRDTIDPAADPEECQCDCEQCQEDDHENCSNTQCTDENCQDCPYATRSRSATAPTVSPIGIRARLQEEAPDLAR
jgi:HK97 family phage prohead protease